MKLDICSYVVQGYEYVDGRYVLVKKLSCRNEQEKEFNIKYCESLGYDLVITEIDYSNNRTNIKYV